MSSHISHKKSGIITIEYVLQQRLFKTQKKKCMSQCESQFNTPQEQGHNKLSPGSFSLLKFKMFLKTKTWEETIMFFSYVVILLRSGEKRLTTSTRATFSHWLCMLIYLFICSFPQVMVTEMQVSG